MLADVGEEQLEAVGRSGDLVRLEVELRLGRLSVALLARAELDAHGLELAREGLDVVVGEVVLQSERLELGRLDVAALLRRLQQRATLL